MVRAAMFASCFAISLTAQQSEHTAGSPRAVSYDRDVRPILADRCFACHGPDETSRKADLRLDLSEHATALRKHAAAIVARDANASEAWRRITSEDDDDRMPPKSSGKPPLSQREREIVRAWIEQGAVYEPHWSFVPPTRPATPVETPNAIDAFVRAELRTHQLQPSERAAPEIQLRRLFLALTGLPPEPGDIAAFCKDPSDTAYAQWITRIFTEEPWRSRYAERMATPWLDSARYADTSGIHMDAGRQIWPFRDWVLEAYRSNMPFDAFVRDQIAGDLWPDATVTQKVASGFHRCHVTTDEGGAIDAEYLVEYAVDRVATTGSVFLGLTLGCARCHDHKYDPISQEDFYGLYAYFASIEEPGLYSQIPDANRALEPFLRVPSDAQLQQEEALKSDLAAVQLELDSVPAEEAAEFARWRSELLQEARVQWPASQVTAAQSQGGADLSIDADGTVTASGKNPDQDVHVLTLRTDATSLRMLHLMALPAPDRQDQRVGRAENGNAVLQSIEVDAVSVRDPQQKRRLWFTWAWADVEQGNGNFHVVNAIASDDGVGWAVDAHMRAGGSREALFVTDEPFGFDGGTELQVTLRYDSVYQRHTFARVRVQLGQIDEQALERLPEASGGFHVAGPFVGDAEENWSAAFGPETALVLDKGAQFLSSKGKSGKPLTWRHREGLREDAVGALPAGANATFVARTLWAPTARKRTFSLGSDDGFRLYASGKEVAQNRIDRGPVHRPHWHALLCSRPTALQTADCAQSLQQVTGQELVLDRPAKRLPDARHVAVDRRARESRIDHALAARLQPQRPELRRRHRPIQLVQRPHRQSQHRQLARRLAVLPVVDLRVLPVARDHVVDGQHLRRNLPTRRLPLGDHAPVVLLRCLAAVGTQVDEPAAQLHERPAGALVMNARRHLRQHHARRVHRCAAPPV